MNLSEDKIHSFIDGCFAAGIKDPIGYLISKRPQVYDWLKGCFPRGILPTDVDGEVEINGNFLRLEFKHEDALRNGRIPKGQAMALRRLTETNRFTIFIIGVSSNAEPKCIEVWSAQGFSKLRETSRDELRGLCRKWSEKAEANTLSKTIAS